MARKKWYLGSWENDSCITTSEWCKPGWVTLGKMGTALKRLKAEGLWEFKDTVCKGERAIGRPAPSERGAYPTLIS